MWLYFQSLIMSCQELALNSRTTKSKEATKRQVVIYEISVKPALNSRTESLTDAGQNQLPNVLCCKIFSVLKVLTMIVYYATPKLQCQAYILPPQHT